MKIPFEVFAVGDRIKSEGSYSLVIGRVEWRGEPALETVNMDDGLGGIVIESDKPRLVTGTLKVKKAKK